MFFSYGFSVNCKAIYGSRTCCCRHSHTKLVLITFQFGSDTDIHADQRFAILVKVIWSLSWTGLRLAFFLDVTWLLERWVILFGLSTLLSVSQRCLALINFSHRSTGQWRAEARPSQTLIETRETSPQKMLQRTHLQSLFTTYFYSKQKPAQTPSFSGNEVRMSVEC